MDKVQNLLGFCVLLLFCCFILFGFNLVSHEILGTCIQNLFLTYICTYSL